MIRIFLGIVYMANPSFTSKCGIMLILIVVLVLLLQYISTSYDSVSLPRFMLSCIRTCDSRKKFASPNLRVELAFAANIVLSRRVVP